MPTEPGKWLMWAQSHGWQDCDVIDHDGKLCVFRDGAHEPIDAHRWNGRPR